MKKSTDPQTAVIGAHVQAHCSTVKHRGTIDRIKAPEAYIRHESEFGIGFTLAKLGRERRCDFGDYEPYAVDDSGGVFLWALEPEELVALILEWQAEEKRRYLREQRNELDAKVIAFSAINQAREGRK